MLTEKFTAAEFHKFAPALKKKHRTANVWFSERLRTLYLFTALFTTLTILLGIRMNEWDETIEGHCYITTGLSTTRADHPGADKGYLGVSAAWLVISLIMAAFGSGAKQVKIVLILALAQFPLHLYMMITLRVHNSNHLEGEESEDDWRFGQTMAILLLSMTIQEIITGFQEWKKFEKHVARNDRCFDDLEGVKSQDEKISDETQRKNDATVNENLNGVGTNDSDING
jgi:hypothetical protein